MEYAIVFPIQLMLTLAIIQLSHLFIAKQVLQYGAFCGARARVVELSEEDATKAALIPISKITGTSGATLSDDVTLPGWGTLPKVGAAREKTTVEFGTFTDADTEVVECRLEHNYELTVPIGNAVAASVANVFLLDEGAVNRYGGAPHVRMKAYCALPKP